MNKFLKHTAALFAMAAVFACGAWTATASAANEELPASAYETIIGSEASDIQAQTSSKTAVLSWQKQSDMRSYSIYAKDDKGKLSLLQKTVGDAAAITELSPKTKYTFVVKGQSGADEIMLGEIDITTTDESADKKLDEQVVSKTVKQLSVSSGIDSVTLDWIGQQGVLSYEVYQKGDDGDYTLLKTTYGSSVTIDALETGKKYTFAVKGRAVHGYTKAKEITVTPKKPAAPKGTGGIEELGVEDITVQAGYDRVTLKWTALKGVESYNIYTGNDKTGYKLAATSKTSSVTIGSLAPETDHTFLIKGQTGEKYTQGSYVMARTLSIEDLTIENVKATAAYGSVTLSWSEQSGVDTYNIYLKNSDGTFAYQTYTRANSITLTGLKSSTSYTYSIKGQANGRYTQSSVVTVKTPGLEALKIANIKSQVTENSITLSWDTLKEVDTYNIYLKSSDGTFAYQTYTRVGSITLTGLKAGTSYTYGIKGQNNGSYTALSTVTVSTLRSDVTIKFEALNQLGGGGNSGSVVATYGCGGTSMTMLLNAKGLNLNKDTVLKKQYANGWCAAFTALPFPYAASNCGSVMKNLSDLAKSYGFTAKLNTSPTAIDIKRVLNGNNLVLVGLRTASGAHHFQITYGYYIKNGVTYFRMQDPYGNYFVDWTESYLINRIYAVDSVDYLNRQVRGIMWL